MRAMLQNFRNNLWTALPASVISFDATKMTVDAQPLIQAQVRTPTGTWNNVTLPVCPDCPVVMPGGGGLFASFPVGEGDEGLLVFASKCVDAWWQSSGVQPQAEPRSDNLSDGFFIPGAYSNPKVPSGGVSTNSARVSLNDGTAYIELTKTGVINLVAPNGINLIGPMNFQGVVGGQAGGGGVLDLTGADLKTSTVTSLNAHVHGGVQTGSGNTGGPTG